MLERMKGLLLLPTLKMATTQQVADFYEVEKQVVLSLIHDNREEIIHDGYVTLKGKEIANSLKDYTDVITVTGGLVISGNKIAYGKNGLFPKRAILRVGMLLRDSEVAKEVRKQLLPTATQPKMVKN